MFALYHAEWQSASHHLFELFVAALCSSQTCVKLVLSLLLYCSLLEYHVVEVPSWVHDIVSEE